jgi:hypothetical protein
MKNEEGGTRRPASFHESIVNTKEAGLLTCNISAVLPIPVPGQWTMRAKTFFVTYSCGTVCDLHTIPY